MHFPQDGSFLWREWAAAWRFITKLVASAFVWIQRDGPRGDKLQKAPFLQPDQPFRLFSVEYFFVQHTSYTAVWSGPAPTLWRGVLTWLKSIVRVVKDDSSLSAISTEGKVGGNGMWKSHTHTYPHRVRLYRLRNGSRSWEGKNKVFLGEAEKAAERWFFYQTDNVKKLE